MQILNYLCNSNIIHKQINLIFSIFTSFIVLLFIIMEQKLYNVLFFLVFMLVLYIIINITIKSCTHSENNQEINENLNINEHPRINIIKVENIQQISDNYNDICPICIDNIEIIESYKLDICNQHIYHKECIELYINSNFTICPLCNV